MNLDQPKRYAMVRGLGITAEKVAAYLPRNYIALDERCFAVEVEELESPMNSHAQPMWSGVVSVNTRGGEMFLRVYRPSEDKEILVNNNNIWKIEVQYAVKREGDGVLTMLSTSQGQKNPDAIRVYKIFFGSESVLLQANPDDPDMKVIEKFYNDAIKG